MTEISGFTFEPVQPTEIPADVALEIWYRSSKAIHGSGLTPSEFASLHKVDHESGSTYVAHYEAVYNTSAGAKETELDTYVVDVDSDENFLGVGEIRYLNHDSRSFRSGKPFVGWTGTEVKDQKRGLGERRLVIMNAASLLIHNLSLHSGLSFSDGTAERVWKRLIDKGVATSYTESHEAIATSERYRFI